MRLLSLFPIFFFFHPPPPTALYPLSLHDALPISLRRLRGRVAGAMAKIGWNLGIGRVLDAVTDTAGAIEPKQPVTHRSEEHTSELQSHHDLVCRLLLEKKKKQKKHNQ